MYRITTDDQSSAQIDALPSEALDSFAEIVGVLQLVPWRGKPYAETKPDGSMRHLFFGHGSMVVYLILDDQLRVDILKVIWVG
ncbi:MAG TPA: hypothetical protein VJ914_22655 [Pseudonocardiaceae bacterium]|nr:hypothetical protein [Pseudonocardiaceae bacterium]